MKVLAINGSARLNGNTAIMLNTALAISSGSICSICAKLRALASAAASLMPCRRP